MNNLVFLGAEQLAKQILAGEVSALEALEAYLNQIERHNSSLNAIITLDKEQARTTAKDADTALAQGEVWGPLHGVPITVKDLLATAGIRTTFGRKVYSKLVPQKDATVVARMRAAGAIILGKTNLPTRSADIQTNNELFGRTNNPWDLNRTPGGSGGGGAAAIAAGMSPLEIGSDLGGSIRLPAHLCGVFAFKPTEHRVPFSAPAKVRSLRHMLVPGILARSVEDLQLGLSLIEGADNRDWQVPPPVQQPVFDQPNQNSLIAWIDDLGVPVSGETTSLMEGVVTKLDNQGYKLERSRPENFDFVEAWQTFAEIMACEAYSSKARSTRLLMSGLSRLVPTPLLAKDPLLQGYMYGGRLSLRRYVEALTRRDHLIGAMEAFFQRYECWLCPVAPGPAFKHCQTKNPLGCSIEVDKQKLGYWTWGGSYTSIFSLTGNPVVVLPIGKSSEGLPIGIQVVGQRWGDWQLLVIAEKLSQVTGRFKAPSGY